MKQWIAIFLCVLLCVSLCACQGKPEPEESSVPDSSIDGTQQTPADTATATDEKVDTTTPQEGMGSVAGGESTADGATPSPTGGSPANSTTATRPGATTTAGSTTVTTSQGSTTATASGSATTTAGGKDTAATQKPGTSPTKAPSQGSAASSSSNNTTAPSPSDTAVPSQNSSSAAPSQGSTGTQNTPSTQPAWKGELPAVGYDPDGKGRISLSAISVEGNVVSATFKNQSRTWVTEEIATLTYTCTAADGTVLASGSVHLGYIACGKTVTCQVTLPAGTAAFAFTGGNIPYWSAWKQ